MIYVTRDFVISRGRGVLALMAGFSFYAVRWLADNYYYNGYYYQNKWLIGLAGLLAVVPVAVLGMLWNRERVMRDPATGRNVRVANQHTFLFVPMQYWGVAYLFYTLIEFAKSHSQI